MYAIFSYTLIVTLIEEYGMKKCTQNIRFSLLNFHLEKMPAEID